MLVSPTALKVTSPSAFTSAIAVSADPFVFCDLPRPFLVSRFLALCREKLEGFGAEREGITPRLSSEPENNSDEFVFEGGGVVVRGERIALSPAEYRLLSLLHKHRGQAVSLKACSDAIGNADKGNAASVYINHLRRKLDYHFDRRMIVTLRQKGYMLLST